MATIIYENGTRENVDLRSLSLVDRLHRLQQIVGGFLESIPAGNGQHVLYWEEAKDRGRAENAHATEFGYGFLSADDYIAGVAVVATQEELDS